MIEDTKFERLGRRSIQGGLITVSVQAVTVIIQLASTVVLARMLTPDDYGIMGMVLSFVALAALFKDLGLSSAAIQKADLTVDQQSNLFWVNAAFGSALTVIFALAAPLVAWFYGHPELLGVSWVLSLTFVIGGLSAQHNAMLVRHMHFGRQGGVNIASIVVTFAVSFILAHLGYRFWALAWGHVAGATTRTLLIWQLSPFVPGSWKNGAGTMSMIRFGVNVTGFNLVNYFSRNLDNILIGKFVGAEALGLYGRAYQLMLFPIINLRGPIEAVTYPALCRLQDNPADWRRYYMQTLRILAFLTMPLVAWLFLVSEQLILFLLGEQWVGVVPLFRILAVVGFIQPCLSMVGSVMLSLGFTRRYFHQGTAMAIVYGLAFGIGVQWGGSGVACAYAVVVYLTLVPLLIFSYRNTVLTLVDFVQSVYFPAVLSIVSLTVAMVAENWFILGGAFTEIAFLSLIFAAVFIILLVSVPTGRNFVTEAIRHIGDALSVVGR